MPTEAKRTIISELSEQIRDCSIAISTNFSGLSANELTELRKQLRDHSIRYRIVKNRLAALAAQEAGVESFGDLLDSTTGIVFGFSDPPSVAKVLDEFVKSSRIDLGVRGGLIGGQVVDAAYISTLASLPSTEELIAKLLQQLQSPISRLVNVLNGPLTGLAMVLQRRSEQLNASN